VALTPTSTNQVQFDNQPPLDKANIINFATVSQVPPLGDQPVADFATATLNGGTKTYVLQSNNTATGLPANGGGPNAVAVITANTTITGAGVEVDALIVRAGATVTIGPSSPLFIDNALLLTPDNTTNYGGTSPTIGLPGAVLFGFRNSPNNAANVISFAPTGQPAVINAQLQGTGGIFFAGTSTTEIQSQAPSVGNQQYTAMPGRYLFLLEGNFDTTSLANGVYELSVYAADVRGNHTTHTERFSVLNARNGVCPGTLAAPVGSTPPPSEPPDSSGGGSGD